MGKITGVSRQYFHRLLSKQIEKSVRSEDSTGKTEVVEESMDVTVENNLIDEITIETAEQNSREDELVKEVASLRQKLDEETKKNEERHRELKLLLVKQELLLKRIAADCFPDVKDLKILPFKNMEEILDVESKLENYSKGELLSYIKLQVGKREIHKVHSLLFSENLLLQINWDGLKGMKKVKEFKFFNTFLYEATKETGDDYKKFEAEMRRGFKASKNLLYKNSM